MYAGNTLKCKPLLAELCRSQHPEILPGFYTDKRHWISVDLGGGLLKDLCDRCFQLVFANLPKKRSGN